MFPLQNLGQNPAGNFHQRCSPQRGTVPFIDTSHPIGFPHRPMLPGESIMHPMFQRPMPVPPMFQPMMTMGSSPNNNQIVPKIGYPQNQAMVFAQQNAVTNLPIQGPLSTPRPLSTPKVLSPAHTPGHTPTIKQDDKPSTENLKKASSVPKTPLVLETRPVVWSTHPSRQMPLLFSQEDLDTVLYGRTTQRATGSTTQRAMGSTTQRAMGSTTQRTMGRELACAVSGLMAGQDTKPFMTSWQFDPSTLQLPEGLEIQHSVINGHVHRSVFATKHIPKGTRYGPFSGRVVHMSEIKTNDDNSLMWEVFKDGRLSHFLDGRSNLGNWMVLVNCARHSLEQNLVAIQIQGQIYYDVCRDIDPDSELLVWYGDTYQQFMGIPMGVKDTKKEENADDTETKEEETENGTGYQCDRCGKVFAYQYYRDKHLKYTRCVDQGDRKFPCHLCSRSFEKRDRLRIHILHVHEKHRPHKCSVCDKSFSQSSSLNKHMRVHSGERPYKCVYCNKAFTASSILRTHIRQHSGEKPFKCKHCGKSFASHAAHDSHVRRTHTKEKQCSCSVCGKTFTQAYELKFHMALHADSKTSVFPSADSQLQKGDTGFIANSKRRGMRSDSSSSGFSDGETESNASIDNDYLPEKIDEFIDVVA